jgi:hypothetical protein
VAVFVIIWTSEKRALDRSRLCSERPFVLAAWRRSRPICQPEALLSIRTRFVPRSFSNSSLNLLFFSSLACTATYLRPRRAPPLPRHSLDLHGRTRRGQSEKCLVVIGGSCSLDPLGSIVSSTSSVVVLYSIMTLAGYLASRLSATCSRDSLRCSITATFL